MIALSFSEAPGAASAGDHAAYPHAAAVVCTERSGDGRSAVRYAGDASRCSVDTLIRAAMRDEYYCVTE